MTAELNRRRALTGAAVVAVGAPVLVACGDDSADNATDPAAESTGGASSNDGGQSTAKALAATSDVPVGGCFVVSGANVVLTQASDGEFKAFSATCTHQGCTVSPSADGVIPCACHGSEFSLEDGSVLQGPATSPLDSVEIAVEGDSITLA